MGFVSKVGDMKGGSIIVEKFAYPDEVAPGGRFEAEVQVSNGAVFVNPFDPDHCAPSGLDAGLQYEATWNASWLSGGSERTGVRCLGTTEVGTATDVVTLDSPAPDEPGTYSLRVTVMMPGSKEQVSETVNFVVAEGSPRNTDPEEEDPENGGGGIGGSIVNTIVQNPVKTAVALGGVGLATRFLGDE